MSISSSLAAGVSGLNAHAQKLASISDNISNSATFGYKRTETDFHSMVVDAGNSSFTAGGVRASTQRLIDQRGQVQGTDNAMDIAVNGRGFIPVANLSAIDDAGGFPVSLATTGSFRADEQGFLVDQSGKVLLGWPATADGTFENFPRDSTNGLDAVKVFHNQFAANPTTRMGVALNLPSSDASDAAALGDTHELTIEYFGNLGQTESLTFEFEPTGQNVWSLQITDSASGNVVGDYELEFNDTLAGGGTLAAVREAPGNPGTAHANGTGTITVPIDGNPMTIEIGQLNSSGGLTQLQSSFAPSNLTKNGSSIGNLVGTEIDKGGIVNAIYDTGFTRPIYKVPVADVANPNGLEARDAQTYGITEQSGGLFFWDAGSGPTGETVGYAREASTTDVAKELTDLIQTQRAYSSNAKVIQTVDEMLQETTNLKR